MNRLALYLLIGGGLLIYFGLQEAQLSADTQPIPQVVSLKDLEGGKDPGNYVVLMDFWADWRSAVFTFVAETEGQEETSPGTPVLAAYYPAFTAQEMQSILEDVKSGLEPQIREIPVLVKTREFDRVRQLPSVPRKVPSLEGLFIESVDPLGKEEAVLLQEAFPLVDFSQVRILEKGREPTGFWGLLMIIGGVLLIILSLFLFVIQGGISG